MTTYSIARRYNYTTKKNQIILRKISGVGKELWQRVIAEVSETETAAIIHAVTQTLKLTGNIVYD